MTAAMPALISSGSSVAQNLASKNSRTNDGTFVPFLIWCSRSFRTTQPGKASFNFLSSVSMRLLHVIGFQFQRFAVGDSGLRVEHPHLESAGKLLLQLQRHLHRLFWM